MRIQEEVESLNLKLADRDANLALFEERSSAMAITHAELEDRHKDTLLGLRETQAKVGCQLVCIGKALTWCAAMSERHMGHYRIWAHLEVSQSSSPGRSD